MSRYKRYPAYKDSGVEWIGEVPEHWEVKRLKYTASSCKNGVWGDDPTGNATEDIPCVRVADFDRDQLRVVLMNPTLRKVTSSERQGRILKYGDLLLEKSGGGEKQPVGCVVQYEDERPAVCSNFIARIEVAPQYSASFLRDVHHSLYSVRITTNSINQTSGIQNLDQERYFNEYAAFPSLNEQKAIVSSVKRETARIDALIAQKTRFIELLKEKRQALITHAVTKGLDPNVKMKDSGVEWIGEVPEHWEVKPIKIIASCNDDSLPESFSPDTPIRYVDISSVSHDAGIAEPEPMLFGDAPSRARRKARAGDVVVSTVRTYLKAVAAVDDAHADCVYSTGFAVLRPRKEHLVPEFLKWLVLNELLIQAIESHSEGLSYPAINASELINLKTTLPSLSEQARIASILDRETARIDALIGKTQRGIDLLKERRSAFITAAVTGQIDLREEA
jgi:type I restriction enzyme S subunit